MVTMKSSKSRRCYIIASANSDTREIQELLRKEGIRPYEKPLINYRTTMFAQVIDIIGESDFVVALVSLKGSQQNPWTRKTDIPRDSR
jgi:uroporphyrinogen-III synthase